MFAPVPRTARMSGESVSARCAVETSSSNPSALAYLEIARRIDTGQGAGTSLHPDFAKEVACALDEDEDEPEALAAIA